MDKNYAELTRLSSVTQERSVTSSEQEEEVLYRQNSMGGTCSSYYNRKKCIVRLDGARYTIGNSYSTFYFYLLILFHFIDCCFFSLIASLDLLFLWSKNLNKWWVWGNRNEGQLFYLHYKCQLRQIEVEVFILHFENTWRFE